MDISCEGFLDRKQQLTFNTLVVCDFNLIILFVAPGYEGACKDSSTSSQEDRISLHVPQGHWLLADAGLSHCRELITPCRGVRSHVQSYRKMMARKEQMLWRHA